MEKVGIDRSSSNRSFDALALALALALERKLWHGAPGYLAVLCTIEHQPIGRGAVPYRARNADVR
jgi:hypothetical protein